VPLNLAEARDTLLHERGRGNVLVTVVFLPRYLGRGPRSAAQVHVSTGALDCIWSGSDRGSAGVVLQSPCGMDDMSADFDAAVVIPRPDLSADALRAGAESSASYADGPVLTAEQITAEKLRGKTILLDTPTLRDGPPAASRRVIDVPAAAEVRIEPGPVRLLAYTESGGTREFLLYGGSNYRITG